MKDKVAKLAALLSEAGRAHHRAYNDTDGYDPEWPIWYADYLWDRMLPLLEVIISKSELIYLLVHLSKVQPEEAPDASWSEYYAEYIVDHYL